MTTNEILINNENPSFSVLSENLEQNIINGEKTATKKDKEYWKVYNEGRKEYFKQKKREQRAKLKSFVVDTNQKQQVVDTAKILPVVGEKRVVDISEVVDKLEKSEVSTTNENEVNEKDVSTTTDANSQVVDNSANVVDCQQCPQLESEREKSREEIEQLKTSIEQWKSDYYELDLTNQELQQKLRNTYSLKFTEKAQQYLGDLVKKHIVLTHKQHLASQQESQERDFLDDWTFKWFFREGGEEIFSNHE